jgi:hypothetical protein
MAGGSEIDDIFSGKPVAQLSKKVEELPTKILKKKKSKAKGKSVQESGAEVEKPLEKLPASAIASSSTSKPRIPETVLDPSIPKRPKTSDITPLDGDATKGKPPKRKADQGDEERFMDSRGTGPRKLLALHYAACVSLEQCFFRAQDGRGIPDLQRR